MMRQSRCVATVVVALLTAASSQAQDSRNVLAEELLVTMRMPELYSAFSENWAAGNLRELKNAQNAGRLMSITAQDVDAIAAGLNWQNARQQLVEMYAAALTSTELARALEFCKTSSGQYLIPEWPLGAGERGNLYKEVNQSIVKEFQRSPEGMSFLEKRQELKGRELSIRKAKLVTATAKLKELVAAADGQGK